MKGLRLSAVVARQGAVGEPALDEVKIQLVIVGHQGDRAHHQGQCHQKGQEPDKTVGALFGFGGAGGERPPFPIWSEASQQTAKLNGNRSGGNGAIMRAIYPGLYYPLQDDAILTSRGQGRLTHWDKDSDEACQIYALMVHCLITEAEKLEGDPERFRKQFEIQHG